MHDTPDPLPSPRASRNKIIREPDPPPAPEDADTPPEPFPVECLPSPLREMVEQAALSSQAPNSLCAAAGLACASAALGAGLCVQSSPGRRSYGNLYFLPVAESGTGKGVSFNIMTAPYQDEENRRAEEWREEIMPGLKADLEEAEADIEVARKALKKPDSGKGQAKEDIKNAKKRKEAAERALKAFPVLNIGNATSEKIGAVLAYCPGEASAILSSEGRSIVDNILGRYGNSGKSTDEGIYLQGYSGDWAPTSRLCREDVRLRAPKLTLFVAFQPDLARKVFESETLMESGFLPRCIIFDPKARPARLSEHVIQDKVKEDWAALISSLLETFHDHPDKVRVVTPSPGARAVLDAFLTEAADNREEGGVWADIPAFAARLAENAWRTALVLHAIEHGEHAADVELSEKTARAAVRLIRWFFASTLELLAPVRGGKQVRRLEKLTGILRDRQVNSLPLRRLKQKHGFSEAEIQTLAENFPQRLRVLTVQTGGRPSKVLELVSPGFSPPVKQ